MEWHRIQTSSPETTIAIQAYNNQIQLTMTTPGAQGYLHLQSDRGGYHLLLSGLTIGLQSIITLGIHHTSVHIQTNLSTKALSRALKDKGDNHRTSYHEYFPLKTEIQTLRDKYDITISKFSQVTSPKQKSEPSPLYYNNTTMVSLRYNGRPTHKYRMYLQTLPCAEEYKTYMITKYNLGPVWEKSIGSIFLKRWKNTTIKAPQSANSCTAGCQQEVIISDMENSKENNALSVTRLKQPPTSINAKKSNKKRWSAPN